MKFKLKKSDKKKWVAALRSGKYKQCKGTFNKYGKYCVMGVCQEIGLTQYPHKYPNEEISQKMMDFNDHGKSFNWLASYIERYL